MYLWRWEVSISLYKLVLQPNTYILYKFFASSIIYSYVRVKIIEDIIEVVLFLRTIYGFTFYGRGTFHKFQCFLSACLICRLTSKLCSILLVQLVFNYCADPQSQSWELEYYQQISNFWLLILVIYQLRGRVLKPRMCQTIVLRKMGLKFLKYKPL